MDFVEICNVYVGKMILKAANRIFNSDKICHSYSDLNFGVTFLEHSVVLLHCLHAGCYMFCITSILVASNQNLTVFSTVIDYIIFSKGVSENKSASVSWLQYTYTYTYIFRKQYKPRRFIQK